MANLERLSENRVKLTITVTAEQFDVALDKAFEKVVKDVKVNGFRPGHCPKNKFISLYGWESLYQDATEFAMQETYYPAVEECGVNVTDYPKIDYDPKKIEKGKPFIYTAEVDVWPEVHLGEYKGLAIKKDTVKVSKADIEEFINNALKAKSENVVKETEAAMGDTVVIDFEGFIDGVAFEGGKGENHPLELGSNSFIPGFEEQLVGVKAEEEKEVKVTFPENYHEGLSGKEAIFKCKVHEVKTKVVPELNDEFVKELEIKDVENVEQYNEYVKNTIKERKTNEAKAKFENECIEAVCEKSFADFPQSLINGNVERRVQQLDAQAKQYGLDANVLLGYYGFASIDDFKKKTEEQVKKECLEELVFDKIAELEKLTATEEELAAKYEEIAKSFNGDVDKAKAQYPEYLLKGAIEREKAVEFIKNSVVSK